MTRSVWGVTAAAILGLALAACGDDDDNGGGTTTQQPATCVPPATATVKFSTDVHPILVANCTGCHGDAATIAKFGSATVGTSYDAVKTQVNTATPAQSAIIVSGNGGNAHPGGDKLSVTETQVIQQWISECAQNN